MNRYACASALYARLLFPNREERPAPAGGTDSPRAPVLITGLQPRGSKQPLFADSGSKKP